MRWLLLLGLASIAVLVNIDTVRGETTDEVSITATGSNTTACSAPMSLTVTRITDYEFFLSWTTAPAATSTIVRAAYGRFPESATDGWEVYNGSGGNTTMFIDTEFLGQDIGIRAWSGCVGDVTSTLYAEGEISGGDWVTVIGLGVLGFLALLPAIVGLIWRRDPFYIISGILWIAVAAYGISSREETYDVYGIVGVAALVLAFAFFLGPLWLRGKTADMIGGKGGEDEGKETPPWDDSWNERHERFRKRGGLRKRDED